MEEFMNGEETFHHAAVASIEWFKEECKEAQKIISQGTIPGSSVDIGTNDLDYCNYLSLENPA